MHLLQASIIVPKRLRKVIITQLVRNVGLFALLNLQHENLFGIFNFGDERFEHENTAHCLQIDNNFEFLIHLEDLVLLQVIPDDFSIIDSVEYAFLLQLGFHLKEHITSSVSGHICTVLKSFFKVFGWIDPDLLLFTRGLVSYDEALIVLLISYFYCLLELKLDISNEVL